MVKAKYARVKQIMLEEGVEVQKIPKLAKLAVVQGMVEEITKIRIGVRWDQEFAKACRDDQPT